MAQDENERRKLEEARRKAEEEEARRLEEEVARRTEALRKMRTRRHPATPTPEDDEVLLNREEVPRLSEEKTRAEADMLIEKAIQSGGKRKLAAIMFTDIMGFSKKMGANEAAAMELLKFHNATMDYLAAKHGGTVVKSIGDSFMVDFSSAVNAVRCAIDAQETFWKYNQAKSELDQIQIRIGIHIGDVITLGKDIFGDGVNIASRIEAITVPGRICVSQDVYNQIKNKMAITAVSAGSVQLKNIDEPIEVYEVLIDSIPELSQPSPLVREALTKKEQEERAKKEAEEAEIAAAFKKKMEEELHKKEEEIRQRREEEERRRREEEERRRRFEEEERRRIEEENRQRQEEEERQKILRTLKSAEKHLSRNEFAKALENVQFVLRKDPTNADALALDDKIRNAQAAYEAEQVQKAQPKVPQPRPQEPPVTEAPAPLPEEPATPPKKHRRLRLKIPTGAVLATLGILAAIAAGIFVFQLTRNLFEGDRYVAILPLQSQSNTEEEQQLGVAIAHETASLLSQASNARILGSITSLNLSKSSRDPRSRANALGFPFSVAGSVSLSENLVSVNLGITDSLGGNLWSGKIEKRRGELAELPNEMAAIIADHLEIALPDDIPPPRAKASAYLLYLRGRELLMSAPEKRRSALRLLQQALAEDPQFPEANAAAALTLSKIFEFGQQNDRQLLSEAEALARKALASQSILLEGHLAIAGIALQQGKYDQARASLQKALDIAPSSSEAFRLFANYYALNDDESKALDRITRAYDLDPVNSDVLTSAGLLHQRFGRPKEAMGYFDRALPLLDDTSTYLAGTAGNTLLAAYQYDRAIALYEHRVSLNPQNYIDQYKLARAYQLAGKPLSVWSKAFEKTISLIRQELQANPQDALATAYLGLALSRYGRYEEGAENGQRAISLASTNPLVLYKVADIYSIQKKKEEALKALDDAIKIRFMLEEIVDLDLYHLSEEPEFPQVVSPMLE